MENETTTIARGCAVILPTLLGQGLIYLCISGKLDLGHALAALAALAAVLIVTVGLTRHAQQRRLVETNRLPWLCLRAGRNGG